MGLTYATLEFLNPRQPEILAYKTKALVDTGSMHLCIPHELVDRLGFEIVEKREVTLANGVRQLCPYVGPIELKVENRTCFVGALVLGTEVLVGAIPLEDTDWVVDPTMQRLIPNPNSRNRFVAGDS